VGGVPAYRIENLCRSKRYRITKEIIADPRRDVVLQRVKFSPLSGAPSDFRLFCLLSPRLESQGSDNTGWLDSHRDTPMLFAQSGEKALALASSAGWLTRSVGYVGTSDPWQDIRKHGQMTWQFQRADHGHIALGGEIDLSACGAEFTLALAFGGTPEAAALNALLSLNSSFDSLMEQFIREWETWQKKLVSDGRTDRQIGNEQNRPDRSRPCVSESAPEGDVDLYRQSMMVLQAHRSTLFPGAATASYSIPWGEVRGDKDAGYHLVWSRDLVEQATGLLAGGAAGEVLETLDYLRATQKSEGGWPQDMQVDGRTHSSGVQLDEAALPILLVNLAHRDGIISDSQLQQYWPMVKRAAAFIIRTGPETGQDRWENTPGLSPYTLATEIAALLIAARMADRFHQREAGTHFRATADLWNDSIEPWTYVSGTPLADRAGVEGYYVRIAPSPGIFQLSRRGERPRMKQARDQLVEEVVSADALALVRFGLRAADDPRIVNTLKVIDLMTRCELPAGPCWRRYNGGYYGESADGEPFQGHGDKHGIGRSWPLLTGERGHYAIAAGNLDEARELCRAMAGFASQAGMLSEQVWDAEDIPSRDLYRGRPSGSAMPLAWTHAEYVRLVRSIRDGRVFDRPDDTWERYVDGSAPSDLALWRFDHQPNALLAGLRLHIEVMAPAVVHFTIDGWRTVENVSTRDTGLEFHTVDLPTSKIEVGSRLSFTFRWPEAGNRWEGKDFELEVVERPSLFLTDNRVKASKSPRKRSRSHG
jgi:glucoamylase